MKNNKLKTPISYYGGKQTMARLILSLLPKHNLYAEPFFGGGAVFFSKPKSNVEVINDLREDVINFYRVCQQDFGILRQLIISTPHSRKLHREAEQVLKYPDAHSSVKRAWAFWVQTNMSFSSQMFGGWGYERKSDGKSRKNHNKRLTFTKTIMQRLDNVQIDCNDALKIIKSYDYEDAFFYVDPPYWNSDCGHYGGYTEEDFKSLLNVLSTINGKFLLSSYDSEILQKFVEKFNWKQHKITKKVAVSFKSQKVKTEVLTANYDIEALLKN